MTPVLCCGLPPDNKTPPRGEEALWWAVIRQAATDVWRGNRGLALDGWEFLVVSGAWMLVEVYHLTEEDTLEALRELRAARYRRKGYDVELPFTP